MTVYAVDRDFDWETIWLCEPPVEGRGFIVRRDRWSDDGARRYVEEIMECAIDGATLDLWRDDALRNASTANDRVVALIDEVRRHRSVVVPSSH